MSWANYYIERLQAGETIRFRPSGHSMTGKINHRDLVEVRPLGEYIPKVGDIVLCSVRGRHYLHLVGAIHDNQYQIKNNRGLINGWVRINKIFGVVTAIKSEDGLKNT